METLQGGEAEENCDTHSKVKVGKERLERGILKAKSSNEQN